MATSVYRINKGINQPIEFKGLKAQYIWWLGGGIVGLLVLFALLYWLGLHTFLCLSIVGAGGSGWILYVFRLSARYGEHGMMKQLAKRRIPKVLVSRSRKLFVRHHDGDKVL